MTRQALPFLQLVLCSGRALRSARVLLFLPVVVACSSPGPAKPAAQDAAPPSTTAPPPARLEATAWLTISDPDRLDVHAVQTADFDADGVSDLLISSDHRTEIWYGPLAGGTIVVGTATAAVAGGSGFAAADVDSDGAMDLFVEDHLLRAPARGVEVALGEQEIAFLDGFRGSVSSGLVFADMDVDGQVDIVTDWAITYGPLAGTIKYLAPLPSSTRGALTGDAGCWGFGVLDVLPDVNGDGYPEVRWGGSRPWEYETGACARQPHHVWSPGDIRNRTLTPDDALLAGLPDSRLGSDADGDGVRDLVAEDGMDEMSGHSEVWSLGTAIRDGALGAPLYTTATGTSLEALDLGDLTGDGRGDLYGYIHSDPQAADLVLVPTTAAAASVLDLVAIGWPMDAAFEDIGTIGDVTGDGVADLLSGKTAVDPSNQPLVEQRIYDGAALRAAVAAQP